ncbi:hypothetical protein HanPI659440_Chr10g0391101 [Helianthus annuus]|nr:hypothetical protein HanPI659440_Chr10g0391101 [Helianthus annuus]
MTLPTMTRHHSLENLRIDTTIFNIRTSLSPLVSPASTLVSTVHLLHLIGSVFSQNRTFLCSKRLFHFHKEKFMVHYLNNM